MDIVINKVSCVDAMNILSNRNLKFSGLDTTVFDNIQSNCYGIMSDVNSGHLHFAYISNSFNAITIDNVKHRVRCPILHMIGKKDSYYYALIEISTYENSFYYFVQLDCSYYLFAESLEFIFINTKKLLERHV